MANARVALARGFSAAVVIVLLLVGGYVLAEGGFAQAGLLFYLLTLLLASAVGAGVWTHRYRLAFAGTVGLAAFALLQGARGAFLLGLAALLGVAVVLGYSGRTREHLEEATD